MNQKLWWGVGILPNRTLSSVRLRVHTCGDSCLLSEQNYLNDIHKPEEACFYLFVKGLKGYFFVTIIIIKHYALASVR